MQQREKRLAIVVAILVAVMGVWYVYGKVTNVFTERENRIEDLKKKVAEQEMKKLRGDRASRKLVAYEERSLPPDLGLARTNYRNWLLSLVNDSKLTGSVNSQEPRMSRGAYRQLNFTVNGSGTMEQLTQFLFKFYSAGHLHQIRTLNIKPDDDGKKLAILLTIEALSMPTAAATTELKDRKSDQLVLDDVAAYEKVLTGRSFFSDYVQPKRDVAENTKKEPAFDAAKHARVTGILSRGGKSQVWLNDQTGGKLLQLSEGDSFEVGTVKGTVKRIDSTKVEVLADGKRLELAIGEALKDAKAMPAEEL